MDPSRSVRVTVLCGGVGAARFLSGLVDVIAPESITAIVNVADDAEFHGLHVSPDLDTVLYTLAGVVDETHGWGLRDDTHAVQSALERLGRDVWFTLGDRDIATHVHRTALLRQGMPLSEVTAHLARAFGVATRLLPASDGRQATMVRTDDGWLAFQDYFVRRRQQDAVRELRFDGAPAAAPGVLDAIATCDIVIVAPSNPLVSIGPILAVPDVRDALTTTRARVAAVSPIVGGEAIKGPAAAMLTSLGHEVSPAGVARMYADFLDVMVIDERDAGLAGRVAATGARVVVAQTIMRDTDARRELATAVLAAVEDRAGV